MMMSEGAGHFHEMVSNFEPAAKEEEEEEEEAEVVGAAVVQLVPKSGLPFQPEIEPSNLFSRWL
jgi:hypothetical protein